MNKWLLDHLVCPRDKQQLGLQNDELAGACGHRYPVIDDIPVMLVDDAESTHGYIRETLDLVEKAKANGELPDELLPTNKDGIDSFVQREVPYTSGNMYFAVQNKLTRYPIPHTHLEQGSGERLLDIGCNWGRWTVAAAKKGYRPIGMDPSLKAVFAARRVARELGVEADFVVGDARFLPFADNSFDVVFSYGVYQHLAKDNVRTALIEDRRVLKPLGISLIQMPNKYGIRQYQQYRRRGFTEGEGFDVRYWTPSELKQAFTENFGPTKMWTDCYFGLGIQMSDADLLPLKYKAVVYGSEVLKNISRAVVPLVKVADSIYLRSINKK